MAITINNLIGGDIIVNTNIKPKLTELCFTAEQANSSVKLQKYGSVSGFNGLEYKLNDGNWTSYEIDSTIGLTNVGDKVYMRAVADGNSRMGTDYSNYHKFVMSGKIAASGNINTLLNPNVDVSLEGKDYCYFRMFYNCSSLTQSPALPATTLASRCYFHMFNGCTSLKSAPELPATTLASDCYNNMFSDCSSLTQAPELPATTLANSCYYDMFSGCSSLTQAPELPATTLASYCYSYMFYECTSLTQARALLATTLADHCYSDMFYGCSSLIRAPELLATTLADWCYDSMFHGCSQFSEVHMKSGMESVYDTSTHGDTTKTVVYDLI